MADKKFHQGDRGSWSSHGSRAYGEVQEEIVDRQRVQGHTANASKQDPQYRVRAESTGRDVAHRAEALRHEPT